MIPALSFFNVCFFGSQNPKRAIQKNNRFVVFIALSSLLVCGFQEDDPAQKNTARVPSYPELDQLVTRASSLAQQGRHSDALDIYEAALRGHPHTLVPVEGSRAIGVRDYVLGQIASWPAEARAPHL